MHSAPFTLFLAVLACTSCAAAAIEPTQSLVGAKSLPSEAALSKETIIIAVGGVDGGDSLDYEWYPENALTVTHGFVDYNSWKPSIKGQEKLDIPPETAMQIRQLLWRIRPEALSESEKALNQDNRPAGCTKQGPHDLGEVRVTFIQDGGERGIEDDRLAIFRLPTPASCGTAAAKEARDMVWKAIRLLPPSKVAAAFHQSR